MTDYSAGITGLAGQWGINPGRVNELENLANLWEQLSGFQVKVPDNLLQEMATSQSYQSGPASPISTSIGHQISTLYDFGQYMLAHVNASSANGGQPYGSLVLGGNATQSMPWAFVGMRAIDYQGRVSSFQSVYQDLIGRNATQDELSKAFALGGGETSASDLRQNIMQDTNMQNTYGWLKFGLNFQGFQRQKADYRTQFGGDITDDQAVLQLKYDHALGHVLGAYQTAQLQPVDQSGQQQAARPNAAIGALQASTR